MGIRQGNGEELLSLVFRVCAWLCVPLNRPRASALESAAQKRLGRPIYKQMCLEWYCLYSYLAVLVLLDWTKV